jgi:hypothetical protein
LANNIKIGIYRCFPGGDKMGYNVLSRFKAPRHPLLLSNTKEKYDELFIVLPVHGLSDFARCPGAAGLFLQCTGTRFIRFSAVNFNNDAFPDLVVFERSTQQFHSFLGTGQPGDAGLVYAPTYEQYLPACVHWALFRDMNGDGATDLLTAGKDNNGAELVRVFRGKFVQDTLKFEPITWSYPGCLHCPSEFVHYTDPAMTNWYPLYVSFLGIPAADDVDADGDIDLLAFDIGLGEHLWWYKNMAAETAQPDTILFTLASSCWGHFADPAISACAKVLSPQPDSCAQGFIYAATSHQKLHPGATITAFDAENDGDTDVLMGSIGSNCLTLLKNTPDNAGAWITEQDTSFPTGGNPVNLFVFPAAFLIDVDTDQVPEILVSSSGSAVMEDFDNVWLYRKTNGGYQQAGKRFMVGQMIDVGTGAHPVFTDVNGDGLMDLVVGSLGHLEAMNPKFSQLVLYLNEGTAEAPFFTLTDGDWLHLSQLSPAFFDFYPSFGDLDGDLDQDIVLGNAAGTLFFIENLGITNGMPQFAPPVPDWFNIDVGTFSAPFIHDLNHDGLPDLLIGERSGNVNFYPNKGTAQQPLFSPEPDIMHLAGVNTATIPGQGYSTPVVVTLADSSQVLFSGCWDGNLRAHPGLSSTADTIAPLPLWLAVAPGRKSSPTFADLNGDGFLEMAVGIQSGGLRLYSTVLATNMVNPSTEAADLSQPQVRVLPNPAHDSIQIQTNCSGAWFIVDLSGKTWAKGQKNAGQTTVQTLNWPAGIYFLQMIPEQGKEFCYKFFIAKG